MRNRVFGIHGSTACFSTVLVLLLGVAAPSGAALAAGYSTTFDDAPIGWQFDAPVSSVGWAIDASPAAFPSGVSRSGLSLNYNNGANYSGTNSGRATSPSIALSGLTNPVLEFWCNYDTETRGTASDRRRIQILSGDGATVLADWQLASTGYAFNAAGGIVGIGPGPCAESYLDLETGSPVAAWHQHRIFLQPSWGTIRVRFNFDTVDDRRNGYSGWAIDNLVVLAHSTSAPSGWPDLLPDTNTTDGDGNELDNCSRTGGVLEFAWGTTNKGANGVHLIVGDNPQAQLDQTYLYYDNLHGHYHMSQYADFSVWQNQPGVGFTKVRRGPKRSFCLLDVDQVVSGAPSSSPGCGASYQQISYGWQDVYALGTAGQSVDVSGLSTGTDYWLIGITDPLDRIRELTNGNQTDQIHFTLKSTNGQVAILDRNNPYPPVTAGLAITSVSTGTFQGSPAVHVQGSGFDTTLLPVVYELESPTSKEAPYYSIVGTGEIWVNLPAGFRTPASIDIVKPSGEAASARFSLTDLTLEFAGATVQGGNGNGRIDPNECNQLIVALANVGTRAAGNVHAVLSTTTPGVAIDQAASDYPNIAPGQTQSNLPTFRVSTDPAFVCGTSADFKLTVTTDIGTVDVAFRLGSGALGAPVTLSSSTPIAIPDLGTARSPIAASGFATPVSSVRVVEYVTHTWDSDLVAKLIGPDGTAVVLADRRGDNGDNFGANCSTSMTRFDDSATSAIGSGAPPFVGSFRPDEPLTAFGGKYGSALNGTWNLEFSDTAAVDVGTIQCWSLEITPIACTDGGGACGPPTGSPALQFSGATVSLGNGNGQIDPNECDNLAVALVNAGSQLATHVHALLSTSTPGVAIDQAASDYPDLAPGQTQSNLTPFRVSTDAGFVCGTTIDFTLDVTMDGATVALHFQLGTGTPGTPVTFSNATPFAIPDLGTARSGVAVTGFSGSVSKVRVREYITHTWDKDLIATLYGPDGTAVVLSNRRGADGDNFGSNCDTSATVFDDFASTAIAAGSAPFVGTFRPDGSLAAFGGKSGTALNGTWNLQLDDAAAADVGTIQCWSLEVTPTSSCAVGGGSCGASTPADGSLFVGQTVPAAMEPGKTYSVSVTMKNTGTNSWIEPSYRLGSQNPQDNLTWGTRRAYLGSGESIVTGQQKTFTFDVTAPSTPGNYDFQWKMVRDPGEWFGALSTNVPVSVSVYTLSGSRTASVNPTNLTAEGTLDWTHWGRSSATSFNHKAGVLSQISNFTVLGSAAVSRLTTSAEAYVWSDGTPTATADTTNKSGVQLRGVGNGFRITVPASPTPRTLLVHVGVYRAKGRLEAALSGGGASVVDTSLVNTSGTSNATYVIQFASGAAQTLTLSWTELTNYDSSGNGRVRLFAAGLR